MNTRQKFNPTDKDLRAFGLVGGAILAFFGFLSWKKSGQMWPYFWSTGFAAAFTALACSQALLPVFNAWMAIARRIAAVNTFIVMAILYYGVFTPGAIILRLRGQDPLERARDRSKGSYWVNRDQASGPEAYTRQF